VFLLIAAVAPPALASQISTTITTASDNEVMERCDQIKIRFGDRGGDLPIARGEEELKMARTPGRPLTLELSDGCGMRIQEGDGNEYEIRVCKAAGAGSSEKARRALQEISVSRSGSRLSIQGPEDGNWLAYLLVKAPKDAEMELVTQNGEIGLTGVSGKIRARSQNGPIALTKCSHEVRATTQNGPISLTGGSGDFRLKAENGPISVDLSGGGWRGEGLEVSTENGPLSLKLPGNFKTGIRVEVASQSAVNVDCEAPECREAKWTWNQDTRRIEFGRQPATVRMTTVNGPVSIQSRSVEF
ncbi:MAG TPA: hypothetical protein VGR38_05765, partial [Candidatus Polarisedimenticolia bacterium]|nr:hypothetical protein [Candidatus Polarisedimenticolia bacterium]